MAGSDKN